MSEGLPFVAGDVFPDFELPDHGDNRRRLSDLVGDDPTVLQFYRGWWCPKEQRFFRRLVHLQDEAEVAYARFVSVSVDAFFWSLFDSVWSESPHFFCCAAKASASF